MVDSLRTMRVSVVKDPVLTPERILDAVSEQLERSGIAGLRLRDVAERLNVSVPSLYRFFEDREAMIAAAYVRDFSVQTFRDLDELREVLADADTLEAYEAGVRRIVDTAQSEDRRRSRWRKLAAMAATRHDPALTSQIAAVQEEYSRQVASLFERAASRGWLRADVTPLAVAYAVQGLAI
ncbi:MAG TPA: TetR/AcrR family transcriptional regulator, partial [Acidimicrobiales bacterium]|nr:TetR/AcrR family transcriptional regulator [Acidimicrobiales bacterium]